MVKHSELRYRVKFYLTFLTIALVFVIGCSLKDTKQDSDPVQPPEREKKDTSASVSRGIYNARNRVLSYFNPVEGIVEGVTDGIVTVRIQDGISVKKGMRFSVFREGEPFYHPVTNELIGKAEDFVGRIEVAGEDGAGGGKVLCSIVEGDIRPGDRIRISLSKIKLAFFQDRKSNWAISESFYDSLRDSGRFELVETYTRAYDPETLSRLARESGAEAVLLLSTPARGKNRFLDIKLYWAEDARIFAEIEEVVGQNLADLFAPDEEFISRTFNDKRPWRTYKLPAGRLIAMGDVDGKGAEEFVVSNGRDIRIYALREEPQELWFIEGTGAGNHISLDILDLNGNGRAEIFVTSILNGNSDPESGVYPDTTRIRSFVIEFDPAEGYKQIEKDMPYFLRVNGKVLLMQRFSKSRIFAPPVYEAKWTGRHYEPGRPLQLPPGVNIYGFTFIDWKDNGQVDLMTFDDKGYLFLYDEGGNLKWKSKRSFGPFTFSFQNRTYSLVNPVVKWSVRGRLARVRTEKGQEIIVLDRKLLVPVLPGLGAGEAEVYALWWNGRSMEERLLLSEISGTVTDYWVQGNALYLISKSGILSLLGNMMQGEFSNSSILYYYNLAPSEEGP